MQLYSRCAVRAGASLALFQRVPIAARNSQISTRSLFPLLPPPISALNFSSPSAPLAQALTQIHTLPSVTPNCAVLRQHIASRACTVPHYTFSTLTRRSTIDNCTSRTRFGGMPIYTKPYSSRVYRDLCRGVVCTCALHSCRQVYLVLHIARRPLVLFRVAGLYPSIYLCRPHSPRLLPFTPAYLSVAQLYQHPQSQLQTTNRIMASLPKRIMKVRALPFPVRFPSPQPPLPPIPKHQLTTTCPSPTPRKTNKQKQNKTKLV